MAGEEGRASGQVHPPRMSQGLFKWNPRAGLQPRGSPQSRQGLCRGQSSPWGPPVMMRVALVAWEPQVHVYSPASSRRRSRSTSSTEHPCCRSSRRPSACSSRPPLLQTTVLGSDSSHCRLAQAPSSACTFCKGSRNITCGAAGWVSRGVTGGTQGQSLFPGRRRPRTPRQETALHTQTEARPPYPDRRWPPHPAMSWASMSRQEIAPTPRQELDPHVQTGDAPYTQPEAGPLHTHSALLRA